ncbi:hypothetical protein Tco_0535051 [Tanacetum coccineum]
MGDENHIRTLGDYSKPSHEGYRNIELPEGNTDPNQHVMDFLKLVDSLDLNGDNRSYLHREELTTHSFLKLFQIFYDQVNLATKRTIDQSAGGKLRDRNVKESWAQLEDLALYDNKTRESSPMLVEAHLAPKQPVQVNKITSSCEIYNDPYDTQYCMENPEQAFVDYASSRTDEVGGKWYSKNTIHRRISKT